MAGPGKDNITGDRYTLDLGVEPDLGNLLQNLTVANQLLDEAENKFKAISTVVGSTTQRVNELTRATQLFVTQTQRIRNEYQGIADASSRIGDLSGGVQAPGMGLIGAGMSPSVTNQLIAQSMMGGAAREPGQREETRPIRVPRDTQRTNKGWTVRGQILADFIKDKIEDKAGGRQKGLSKQAIGDMKWALESKDEYGNSSISLENIKDRQFSSVLQETGTTGGGFVSKMIGGLNTGLGALGLGGVASKILGPAMNIAGTPIGGPLIMILALKRAVDFAYGIAANTALKAQEYTQLTGGTSVASSGYTALQGLRGEELRASGIGGGFLGGVASMLGYSNPLFNREQSREAMALALGAGYRQNGSQRRDVFDYLRTTTIKGFGTMAENLDIYQEAVDKAGGSTAGLVSAIDKLKQVAQNSDVSIQTLATNFKNQIEMLTGYGMGGTNATAYAALSSSAYSKAGTYVVRNSPGPDIASPFMQAKLANYFGVSYLEVPATLGQATAMINGQMVGTTGAVAQASDSIIISQLQQMGFRPGMTRDEIARLAPKYAGALSALGFMPGIDPTDTAGVINWIQQYIGGPGQTTYKTPMTDEYNKQRENSLATLLGDMSRTDGTTYVPNIGTGGAGMATNTLQLPSENALDKADVKYSMSNGLIDLDQNFGMYNYGDQTRRNGQGRTAQAAYIEQWYEAQLNNKDLGGKWLDIGKGGMNMPIMNEILKMDERDLRNVYVNLNGRKVNLSNAIRGNAQLSADEAKLLQQGLAGEVDMGYQVKDEQGLFSGGESQLSNLKIDNETRAKEDAEANKPDGSMQHPYYVKQVPNGPVGVGGGRVWGTD